MKCSQKLWGTEICFQEPHKSPGFLTGLATAACACSLHGGGGIEEAGGEHCRDAPTNNVGFAFPAI